MVDYEEELDRYLDEIKELARSKQYARLRDLFLPMEPADIALLLEESGGELMPLLYRLLPKELAAEVFVELESDSQEMLINGFSNTELKEVLGRAVSGRCRGHRGGDARQRGDPNSG